MKIPSLFTKTPSHKRFGYTPRFYDPREEERKEREERIKRELKINLTTEEEIRHSPIAGSFKQARKSGSRQSDPSSNLLRILILTFLSIWLIAYLQFGYPALYALFLFVPFYLYLKFKKK